MPIDSSFVCPLVPFLPLAGIILNLFLMVNLGLITWLRMLGWGAIGLCIYAFYGAGHSRLNAAQRAMAGGHVVLGEDEDGDGVDGHQYGEDDGHEGDDKEGKIARESEAQGEEIFEMREMSTTKLL